MSRASDLLGKVALSEGRGSVKQSGDVLTLGGGGGLEVRLDRNGSSLMLSVTKNGTRLANVQLMAGQVKALKKHLH